MVAAWDSAQMFIVQKPMHTNFVELYKQIHSAIVGFLKNNVWQFKKANSSAAVVSTSDILQVLGEDIEKIRNDTEVVAEVKTNTAVTTDTTDNVAPNYLVLIHQTLQQILKKLS